MTTPTNDGADVDDEFANEDEPIDVKQYITPEYVKWLEKTTEHAEAARKLHDEGKLNDHL